MHGPAPSNKSWLPEWVLWLAERKYWIYPALAFFALMLYLPGLAELPPMDRDEPRFAQASKQMVETGDYVRIMFQDEPRLKKPIGIYWLQSASAGLLAEEPDALWTYRLPSLIGAVAAVLLCAAIGGALFKGPVGGVGGMLLAPVLLMTVEANLAKTDAVLLATILAAQWALARAWMAGRTETGQELTRAGSWTALAFWLAIGCGVLVKGPVILMIVGLTALGLILWQRRARWFLALRPLWGVPVALLVIAPWFVAIHFATDGAFWEEALGRDFLAKIGQGQEAHGAPPGFYLLLVFVTFWPAAALLGMAVLGAWRGRGSPAVQFCTAWIVPNWIVFELVATKLPHYVLPLYPALALLAAYMLVRGGEAPAKKWAARLAVAPVWIAAIIALGLAVAMVFVPPFFGGAVDGPGIAAGAAFAALAYTLYRYARGAFENAFPLGVVMLAAVLAYWPAYRNVVPSLSELWVSNRLATAVVRHAPPECVGEPELFTIGYNEPSLIFLAGTETSRGRGPAAVEHLVADPACHVAAIESREWPRFEEALGGREVRELARVTGLNYSKGKKVSLRLVQLGD